MTDFLTVKYKQSGKSSNTNSMGMREMQARAFEARKAQYLLLKAPPASGKSRALMFLSLDKLVNQGLKKIVVAVPEMSIGGSFKNTKLTDNGFFSDWSVNPKFNLCVAGSDSSISKTKTFQEFMETSLEQILVCTHATLRFAFEKLDPSLFNETLLAIDEFHHTSAGEENKLGALIDVVMKSSTAHIIAMTGSYFRGDAVPILVPEVEAKFTQITYSYYEQLNGYKHLKSLGIGYHFYTGSYLDAIHEVLDTHKKTIVHIPNVNSSASTKDKLSEVDHILDALEGTVIQDPITSIMTVTLKDGRKLLVADLVDDSSQRRNVQDYLRNITRADQMDIIIALGMAKEGFDWPWCEHVLTVGYRSSLTEIIQIIGRATRDSEGKNHAQFTNLIAQPDADDEDVKVSVNNMLKAITVSLLMEQVLAPPVNFRPRSRLQKDEYIYPGTIVIEDSTTPVSDRVTKILDNLDNIKAAIFQEQSIVASAITGEIDPKVIAEVEIPKIVERLYPDIGDDECLMISDIIHASIAIGSTGGLFDEEDLPSDAVFEPGNKPEDNNPTTSTSNNINTNSGRKFILMGNKFINIENLNIDLIKQVNPFQGAYEILSKSVTTKVLKTIQDTVVGMRADISEEEAVILWDRIQQFLRDNSKEPSHTSSDPYEKRLAAALAYIKNKARERAAAKNLR